MGTNLLKPIAGRAAFDRPVAERMPARESSRFCDHPPGCGRKARRIRQSISMMDGMGFYSHVAGGCPPGCPGSVDPEIFAGTILRWGKISGNGVPGGYPLISRFFPGKYTRDWPGDKTGSPRLVNRPEPVYALFFP
jgi:hypothetical protein